MPTMISTLRILEPYPGIFAYYDGRIAGRRLHSAAPNWLDDGAYSLGIASYAIVDGKEALVYDTHISLEHARAIRAHLEGLGVRDIRVVLSHWHDDHIAGNAVFGDCEIIALKATAEALERNRDKIEHLDPPIMPLIMPNRIFEGRLDLTVGRRQVELHHFDIHSADGAVLWIGDIEVLLAGDTVEDTVTYISEPENTAVHIRELERLRDIRPIRRILPNHGDPQRIAAGGYDVGLIDANRRYLHRISDALERQRFDGMTLEVFVAEELARGAIAYFAPYETVHAENIKAMKTLA